MKYLILSALAAMATADVGHDLTMKFINYMGEHDKSYETVAEFEHRMAQFLEAESFILQHSKGNHTFTVAHNKFSDRTEEEMKMMRGRIVTGDDEDDIVGSNKSELDPIDWRTKGAVGAVKD